MRRPRRRADEAGAGEPALDRGRWVSDPTCTSPAKASGPRRVRPRRRERASRAAPPAPAGLLSYGSGTAGTERDVVHVELPADTPAGIHLDGDDGRPT